MVRILGLVRGGWSESPREITSRTPLASTDSGDNNGWLIRFFDSAFFCEWIAVSYLYKHHHSGVRDYLCNRMYTLPLSGIETYLFQICYMMVHKPSPSLDKFVIDICSNSLKIALKVHWFLLAELEDVDDNQGITRIQEKCQLAATLMGDWPLLLRHANTSTSPSSKLPVLNRILSSKQRLLSLATSPPAQRSPSSYPSPGNNLQDGVDILSPEPEENKIFKRFILSPRVRDALLFRKSAEKDEDESENDGFFKRFLRDSKCEDRELASTSEGFFKRLLRDSKGADDELRTSTSESFLKRLLRDSNADDELASSSDGFYKRLFLSNSNNDCDEKPVAKSVVDDEKDGSFQKLLKEKFEDKKDFVENNENGHSKNTRARASESAEDEEKNGFFRKILKDVFEEKKIANDKSDDGHGNGEEEELLDFSLFLKLFRVHPVENKNTTSENKKTSGSFEGSPGTENFFRKLFRDRDRCVEDSEIFGSKKHKEKRPGSPKQKRDKSNSKPPLSGSIMSQSRKGAYHDSLDFVQSLCETSYRLVDFQAEDRHTALYESIAEINSHVAGAETNGGVCFPAGKGMFRMLHIPEDEAVLLNSREKAPYMICVEVLKCEMPSNTKDSSGSQKHSGNGIPLADGDTLLAKPPPWAYPLGATQDVYHSSSDRISSSAAEAIDQAMSQNSETTKLKTVNVSLYVEKNLNIKSESLKAKNLLSGESSSDLVSTLGFMASMSSEDGERMDLCLKTSHANELELVRVVLTGDPGIRLDNIEDQRPPHCKELRCFPSILAQEDINAAVAKGEAPSGLPLKGACQTSEDPSDALSRSNGNSAKANDALCGELWEEKKKRIKKASAYGKLPGWDLRSVIVKSGDDCRQEHLAVQLISHFYDIFQEAGLPLWLRPYEVIVTSSYSALIETIPDTASLHSIKSRFPYMSSLREFFAAKYQENSQSFKLAQRNFVESMAGYSLVCYILQVKDRHNGNLLLDEEGHVIHIDFGFMLSNSPGGVNFESAPFKLTRELLEVMDSDGEGVPSEFFDYFKVLCIQGFLTCRKHAERIILLAEMLEDSGFPCFSGGPRTIQNLRKRFHLSLTEEQCVSFVLTLISSSLDAWRTRQYDYYQRVLNGIL